MKNIVVLLIFIFVLNAVGCNNNSYQYKNSVTRLEQTIPEENIDSELDQDQYTLGYSVFDDTENFESDVFLSELQKRLDILLSDSEELEINLCKDYSELSYEINRKISEINFEMKMVKIILYSDYLTASLKDKLTSLRKFYISLLNNQTTMLKENQNFMDELIKINLSIQSQLNTNETLSRALCDEIIHDLNRDFISFSDRSVQTYQYCYLSFQELNVDIDNFLSKINEADS